MPDLPGPPGAPHQPDPSAYSSWYGPAPPKNGLGISALVFAIAALVFVWTAVGGILLGALAAVLGCICWRRIRRGEANNRRVTITAIVLSFIAIAGGVIFTKGYIDLFSIPGMPELHECRFLAGDDEDARSRCRDEYRRRLIDEHPASEEPTR